MKLTDTIPLWLRAPRNTVWLVVAVVLLVVIGFVSPVQLPVVLYKASLVALFAVVGYYIDRGLFPYARPDGFLCRDWRKGTKEPEDEVDYPVVPTYQRVYCAAMVRRAVVVGTVVLAGALGL